MANETCIRAGKRMTAAEAAGWDEGFALGLQMVQKGADEGLTLRQIAVKMNHKLEELKADSSPLVRAAAQRCRSSRDLPPAA